MPDRVDEHADPQLQFLRELVDANAPIAGDVARISEDTWAIHGIIPVDGDVILAEFDSYEGARITLDQLPAGSQSIIDA